MAGRVREFWLENSAGAKYQLNTQSVFFHQPTGLGYAVDLNTLRLGESNLIVSEDYNLGTVEGEVLFIGDRGEVYQKYFEFAQFLYYRPIILHYRTPNTFSSFRCQVRVVSVEKSEVNSTDGFLHIPISMYKQTMWYSDEESVISVRAEYEESKEYPLDRPYHYGALSTAGIDLVNGGVANTPMIVQLEGECTDVMWTLYDGQQNAYGATRILGTYNFIRVDSSDLAESIALETDGIVVPNAINYQDLTVGDPRHIYVTFLKLKPGRSKLVFNLTDEYDGTVTIRWRNAYVTV